MNYRLPQAAPHAVRYTAARDGHAAALSSAAAHLKAGRPEQAEAIWRRILEIAPRNADALGMLGVCRAQRGNLTEAIGLLRRAVDAAPAMASALANLANVLAEASQNAEALECYDRVIPRAPANPQLHLLRGALLVRMQRYTEALESLHRSLLLDPANTQARIELAGCLLALERSDEAAALLENVIALTAQDARANALLGRALKRTGRIDDALVYLRKAAGIDPLFVQGQLDLADLLEDLDRLPEALDRYRHILRQDPVHAQAYNNQGIVLQRLGRHEEAMESFDRALALEPGLVAASLGRAVALSDLQRDAQALESLDAIIATEPDLALAHYNRALCLLRAGRLGEGWNEYEWRWRLPGNTDRADRAFDPAVLPAQMEGQSVLIESEQGYGDMLQFCRYVPQLQQRGARAMLEAPTPLVPLLQDSFPEAAVIAAGAPRPAHDLRIALMSLPRIFGTTLDTIPCAAAYLRADPERRSHWAEVLGARDAIRVGLAWSGNAKQKNDLNRSLPFAALLPLFAERPPGGAPIQWISLQKDVRPADREPLQRLPIADVSARLNDFADTAALVDCLDLVICVDTAIAHLAGALGRPVWVMLGFAPDFRWLRDRVQSPWYPTARLFRQPDPGNWTAVVDEIARALALFRQA